MHRRQSPSKPTLAGLLRAARAEAKMPLRTLATKTGVTSGFLSDLELGRRMASADVLRKIEAALAIESGSLVRASARSRIAKLRDQIEELQVAAK